jgi:hypothetical protein
MCLILALGSVEVGSAASIGIFGADDCSTCDLSIAEGETRTIVIAVVNASHAVAGASVRVEGLPSGWTATAVPPVGSGFAGNPFGPNGGVVGFSFPQLSDCIRLYTVQIHATSTVQDALLRVVAPLPPFTPPNCPAIVPCINDPCGEDPPQCVIGGTLLINSSVGCTVGTTDVPWGAVKSLFQ